MTPARRTLGTCVILGLVLATLPVYGQVAPPIPPQGNMMGSGTIISGSGASPYDSFAQGSPVPGGPVFAQPNPTQVYASAEWLFMNRTHAYGTATPFISGPDAFSFKSQPFNYTSGYRIRFGVESCEGWGIDSSYNDFGGWNLNRTGALTTGVAFDDGVNAGNPFAGMNAINGTTYFAPINAAALSAFLGGPDESTEFEGFGPNAAFADAPATFTMSQQSSMWTVDANLLNHEWNGRVQYGFGYSHAQVIENAMAAITGTLRAADGVGIPDGGLSNLSLTSPIGGNLGLISGTADGWDDESGVSGNPGPDTLTFTHRASVQNYLNGGQAVLRLVAVDNPGWMMDINLKGGVYHNRVTGTITETYAGLAPNDNSVYGRNFTDSRDVVSFLGTTGLGGAYKFTENFRITGGYDVWFISGVALASDQVKGIRGNTYQVQTDGNFLAHGSRLGMEFRY